MQTQKQVCIDMVESLPTFLLKLPQNALHKITIFRNLAGFFFPVAHQITGHNNSPDYWTQGFPVKGFCEIFNMTSYYAEDTLVL